MSGDLKGHIVTFQGTYAVNPEFYEFEIETDYQLPVGEHITFEGDPSLYRIVKTDGLKSTIRMVTNDYRGDGGSV